MCSNYASTSRLAFTAASQALNLTSKSIILFLQLLLSLFPRSQVTCCHKTGCTYKWNLPSQLHHLVTYCAVFWCLFFPSLWLHVSDGVWYVLWKQNFLTNKNVTIRKKYWQLSHRLRYFLLLTINISTHHSNKTNTHIITYSFNFKYDIFFFINMLNILSSKLSIRVWVILTRAKR